MRYAWDLQHQYLREHRLVGGVKGSLARLLLHGMRNWDYRTANGVDHFVSNSQFIAQRVWKTYRRESTVIHPPVDTDFYRPPAPAQREDFYFTASRMVPYKRIGLILDAFAELPDRRLVVIGDGPEFDRLRKRATPNVTLLGRQPARVLREHLQRARAFVFAALEDFGIAPVEAQACGTPVIAFGQGGAAETVVDGTTGVLFSQQTPEALIAAIRMFELRQSRFNAEEIRANALRFSAERFRQQLSTFIASQLEGSLPSQRVAS
jgi:glycosyltransferase involved in cell wall biosynthesis